MLACAVNVCSVFLMHPKMAALCVWKICILAGRVTMYPNVDILFTQSA